MAKKFTSNKVAAGHYEVYRKGITYHVFQMTRVNPDTDREFKIWTWSTEFDVMGEDQYPTKKIATLALQDWLQHNASHKTKPASVKSKSSTARNKPPKESKNSVHTCSTAGKARVDFVGVREINGVSVRVFSTDSPVDTRHVHTNGIDVGSNRILPRSVHNKVDRVVSSVPGGKVIMQFGIAKIDGNQVKVYREIVRYDDNRVDSRSWRVTDNYVPKVYPVMYAGIGADYVDLSVPESSAPITESWSKYAIDKMVKARKAGKVTQPDIRVTVQGDGSKSDPYDRLIAQDGNEAARKEAKARGIGKPFSKLAPTTGKAKSKRNKATNKPTKSTRKQRTMPVKRVVEPVATITGESVDSNYLDCLASAGWL